MYCNSEDARNVHKENGYGHNKTLSRNSFRYDIPLGAIVWACMVVCVLFVL